MEFKKQRSRERVLKWRNKKTKKEVPASSWSWFGNKKRYYETYVGYRVFRVRFMGALDVIRGEHFYPYSKKYILENIYFMRQDAIDMGIPFKEQGYPY